MVDGEELGLDRFFSRRYPKASRTKIAIKISTSENPFCFIQLVSKLTRQLRQVLSSTWLR